VTGRVLVAGIGNIFLGDDGFGPAVAQRLADASLPEGVRVADYGTSGMHLAYDLASYQTAILVDAAARGEVPGTVSVLEVGPEHRVAPAGDGLATSRLFDSHGMQPDLVLGVLDMLGAQAIRVLVVCCEPASTDYGIGLSEPIAAAVDEAARVVTDLAVAAAGPPPAAVTQDREK
jgi:hydrogenase maturation protease